MINILEGLNWGVFLPVWVRVLLRAGPGLLEQHSFFTESLSTNVLKLTMVIWLADKLQLCGQVKLLFRGLYITIKTLEKNVSHP